MSMINKIEEMIFQAFSDEQTHTVEEFQNMAIAKNIISAENQTAVRNTIHKLNKDPRFETVGRGKYVVHTGKVPKKEDLTVEIAGAFLSRRLKEIKKMDVIKSSSEELEKGKREAEIIKKYAEEYIKAFN